MKKPFRHLIAGLSITIGTGILLGVAVLWYLHTDLARTQILNALNRRIPGSVSVQRYRLSLLNGRIDIWNLRIVDFFQEEAVQCDHLSISISWRQLLLGKLHVVSARIEKPRIRISVEPDGYLNFSRIFSEPSSNPATPDSQSLFFLPLVLDAITLSGASLSYVDEPQSLSICLENMDADFSADFLKQAGKTNLRIGNGLISSPFFHTAFGPVSFQGNLQDGQLSPLYLGLLSPGLNAEFSGSMTQIWQKPQLNLRVTMDSTLSAIRQSLDLNIPISGHVHAAATISGSIENPDVSLNMTCPQVQVSEYWLDDLRMTADIKDRIMSIESIFEPKDKGAIHITGAADLRQAFSTGVFAAPDTRAPLSADMQIKLDSVNLSAFHPEAAGRVSGMLSLQSKGTLDQPLNADLEMDIQAGQVSLRPGAAPVNMYINGQARWDSGSLDIHHLNARAGTTLLSAKGFWNSTDNTITGELTGQSDDLSSSLLPLGIRGAAGNIRAQAKLSGSLMKPACSLKIKSAGLGFRDIQIGALDLDAEVEPSGILSVSTLSLKNQKSELTAQGRIPVFSGNSMDSARPLAFTAAFHQVAPENFLRSSIIHGMIDGNCKLEGTEKSLSGSLKILAKDLKIDTVRLGNATGEFQLSKSVIQIQRLFLENRHSHADFAGSIQAFKPGSLALLEKPPFNVSCSGTRLSAEDFVDFLKGKFSLAAKLEGTPGQFQGAATLESEDLNTGQKIFGQNLTSLQLAAGFQDKKLTVSRARATVAPGEGLEASGWIAMDETFHFDFKTGDIGIDHIDALAGIRPDAVGKLRIALSGSGSLDHPRIQGDVALNPFRFYGSNWDNTRLQVDMVDQLATFHMQSPIRGSASYQFQTHDYTADLNFSHMELSPFFQTMGLAGIGGMLTGKLSGSGNLSALKTLKADAVFSELLVSAKGKPIIEGRNLQLGIQNEAVVVPKNHLTVFEVGSLDIGCEARPGQSVSLLLNADIPLNAAMQYNESLSDLRGNLIISAIMKGPWYSPDIEAFVDIQNGGMVLNISAQDFHDVNGRIHLTPKTLNIEHFEGQLDSGFISIKGEAELDAFRIQSMDFKMAASQLPIKIEDTLDAKLNADLTLHGTAHGPAIQGEIVVLEGLYYKNVNLNPLKSLFLRERSFQVKQEVVFPAFIQNALLDVRIPPRNLFVVDNNLAQLNLSPDMHITGTLQRPIIQGRTRVDSGSLQYQSTTFTVKKGFVDFTNPYTLESVIDIQSQATVQNWNVFLDISGPLDKLNLKLSSSPFLDDNDLLSLLITGKTSRASISKTSESSTSSQKMLADLLSASIGSDFKKASGLDILEVDSTGERRYVNDDPLKVTFGKIISPQITLKYSVETKGGVTFQRTITEYMFIENILLSGFQDSRGVFGGEIKFRHEFR